MNIHEYQAKILFGENGIPILSSRVIKHDDDVQTICESIKDQAWIVKAQVHAGGRGKVGGVVIVRDARQLEPTVTSMLGKVLVTKQTDEQGLPVSAVLLEELTSIEREIYLAMLVDRGSRQIAIIASAEGGMDIEQVAEQTPEKIFTHYIHPSVGLQPNQIRDIGYALHLGKSQIKQLQKILHSLFGLFIEHDCSLVEINPLIVNEEGDLIALDAKISIDDNALYRHQKLQSFYDASQQNQAEATAKKLGLNYIKLDGNIGCIVNGAGLAMATMDLVKHHGGEPANFLDVGGGTTQEKVAEAFKLVSSDKSVQSIFVNIFGGIVRCDLIAQGILDAQKELDENEISLNTPVVVLLQGTNAEEGKKLLEEKSSNVIPVDNLTEGAQQAIALATSASEA
ncbi:MAG: ADP-forming succinate--CoA ligase subunit beta [Gammaproteobacteria bacterium]|nr:MAG: ADP-forming succinate--CoA ligase subunit beta [Gammaproteobacteria bacterium]